MGENQIDVAMKIRDQGYTPSIPDDCDPVLKELMQMCWKVNPDDRPVSSEPHLLSSTNEYVGNACCY